MLLTIEISAESKEQIMFYLASISKEARLFLKDYQYSIGTEESLYGTLPDGEYNIKIDAFASTVGGENA